MSKVFCSFRALGLVCNDIPLILRYNKFHNEYYISTIIGNYIHSYKLSNLGLKTVSCEIPNIFCLSADSKYIYVSSDNVVYSIIRGIDIKHTLNGSKSDIICLLPFQDFFIAANKDREILLWHLDTQVLQSKIIVGPGKVTSLLHPFAYKNKLLIGFDDGALQLWNISTCQLIHTFSAHLLPDSKKISVSVLQQAPALHVVAVGFSDGRIALLHLQEDNLIRDFQLDWGSVTSISFKHSNSSASDENCFLLVGSAAGHVTLWEVSNGRLVGELRHAHRGAVTGLVCVQGQPLLVSNASDNALRVWLWETGIEVPRLLHERAGHAAPPSVLLALDANGHQLLSSGKDAVVREFSTVHDRHNRSFGRSAINRKQTKKLRREVNADERDRLADVMFMPEVTCLTGSLARAGDWDSLVAAHLCDRRVSTWDVRRGCRGRFLLQPGAMLQDELHFKTAVVTSVFVTSCGNFVLVGYSTGHIVRFNLQSGQQRCVYPQKSSTYKKPILHNSDSNLPLTESRHSLAHKPKKEAATEWIAAHTAAVAGLACDTLNRVVSSAGAVGCCRLFFFHFKTGAPLGEPLQLGEAASTMELHRTAGYLVIGMSSGRLLLVDAFRRRIVRRFLGHCPSQLSAIALSPCTFQLLSAGTDGLLRLWDLLEGKLIDCFRVTSPATALLWLPQGDLMASCHRDQLGVHLWTNRSAYEANLVLTPLPEDYEPPQNDTVSLPTTITLAALTDEQDMEMQPQLDEDAEHEIRQLRADCLTLSGQPESRITQLLHLEDFRELGVSSSRDKVKTSIEAPFFIPSVKEQMKETIRQPVTTTPTNNSSWVATADCLLAQKLAPVVAVLGDCDTAEVDIDLSAALWEPIFSWLESLAPSMLDAQILDLSSCTRLTRAAFLRCCSAALQARRHFDTACVYLAVALRHWGVSVAKESAEDEILCRELRLVLNVETQVCDKFFRLSDDIEALVTIHQTGLLGLHLD